MWEMKGYALSTRCIALVPGTERSALDSFSGLIRLLGRDYDVLPIDFKSNGGLSPNEQLDNYTNQIEDKLAEICGQFDEIDVIGYSLGSLIAMQLAGRGNIEIGSLILLGAWLSPSAVQIDRHELWLKLFQIDPVLAGELSRGTQYSALYRKYIGQQQLVPNLPLFVPTAETLERVLVNRYIDVSGSATAIRARTLVINGSGDQKVPTFCGYEVLGAIGQCQLAMLDSGHALLAERLGQVYGLIVDFIEKRLPARTEIEMPRV